MPRAVLRPHRLLQSAGPGAPWLPLPRMRRACRESRHPRERSYAVPGEFDEKSGSKSRKPESLPGMRRFREPRGSGRCNTLLPGKWKGGASFSLRVLARLRKPVFLLFLGFCGNAVGFGGPIAEVDELAAIATEGPV